MRRPEPDKLLREKQGGAKKSSRISGPASSAGQSIV